MRFYHRLIRSLVLPNNAGPTDPRLVIGPDIPPELVAYFAAFGSGYQVVQAILWYFDFGVDYRWVAQLNTHVGDAFERGMPTGFTIAGTVYHFDMLNFDISSGNVIRWNLGGFTAETEEYVFSGSAGSKFDIMTNVNFRMFGFNQVNPTNGVITPGGANDFTMDGTSIGRGMKSGIGSTSDSAAIGTTETVVLTISGFTFKADRAYRISYGSRVTTSLATNTGNFQVRKTNAAGTVYGIFGAAAPSGTAQAVNSHGRVFVQRNATDLTTDVVLTLQASSGTVVHKGSATGPRYMVIEDVTGDTLGAIAVSVT